MTVPRWGLTADKPRSPDRLGGGDHRVGPRLPNEEALSSSRTATTTWALGLSCRTVKVTRIAESSRSSDDHFPALMIGSAQDFPSVESPSIAASPRRFASPRLLADCR